MEDSNIRQLCPKPSDAVNAVIVGLRTISKRPDFEVRMTSFGHVQEDICYGCAATCAVLHLIPDAPIAAGWRQYKYRFDRDLEDFELMVDELRKGRTYDLLDYYADVLEQRPMTFANPVLFPKIDLPRLTDNNWQNCLPIYEAYRDQLIEQGL